MSDKIIHHVRLARGAQAGGHYGLAKLLWALVFSEEIKASNATGIPRGEALLNELEAAQAELRANGADDALLRALDAGVRIVREDSTAVFTDIPEVRVSRTDGHIAIGEIAGGMSGDDDALDMRLFQPIHYLEPLSPAQVQAALREFPSVLIARLEGLSEAQMSAHPFAGEWSIRELIHHFTMAQALLHDRIGQLLAADNPTLKAKAVWTMAAGNTTTADLLSEYRASRASTLEVLAGLPADAWWRGGYHDEFGPVTILSQTTYFTRHERSHVPQLMALVRAGGT